MLLSIYIYILRSRTDLADLTSSA